MKTLLLAFGLVCLASAVAFFVLRGVGVEANSAAPLAASLWGGLPQLKQALERHMDWRTTGAPIVHPYSGFTIHPALATLYGASMMAGALGLVGGVAGEMGGMVAAILASNATASNRLQAALFLQGVLVWLVILPVAFLIGRWIGRRVLTHGVLVTTAVVVLARLAMSVLDLSLLPPAVGAQMALNLATVSGAIKAFALGALGLGLMALLGYWRGTRQRLSSYLSYVLGRVSSDTRDAIVALAYDEAVRAQKANAPAPR